MSRAMSRSKRLTERAITFALAEPNEDLAVARLAFLAQDDDVALDAAIDACLARRDRSLHTRWRAISFLVRVRYEDHRPTAGERAAPLSPTASSAKGQARRSTKVQGESTGRL